MQILSSEVLALIIDLSSYYMWELKCWSLLQCVDCFQVDSLSSGLSASEEMALMKKLNALELENKGLKKGKTPIDLSISTSVDVY